MLTRRLFAAGLASALAAPAIVPVERLMRLPVRRIIRPPFHGWYSNRVVRTLMDVETIKGRNVLLRVEDFAGHPNVWFHDIPIRIVDARFTLVWT